MRGIFIVILCLCSSVELFAAKVKNRKTGDTFPVKITASWENGNGVRKLYDTPLGAVYSCYVKFKGLNPRFHVFFVFSRFLNSFLSFEDKNPPSAISCSPFYVKLFLLYFSIKKSDTVIGGGLIIIRSPTRMGPQLVGVGLLCV